MNKNELNNFINELRRKNPAYCTNLYQSLDLVEEKIRSGQMECRTTANLLLLSEADDDLTRIYFCARDEDALRTIIPNINSDLSKIVIDVIGRGERLENLSSLYYASLLVPVFSGTFHHFFSSVRHVYRLGCMWYASKKRYRSSFL